MSQTKTRLRTISQLAYLFAAVYVVAIMLGVL